MHYWITGNADGKEFLYYGGDNERQATEKAYQLVDCYFEVIPLNTRDQARASQMLKGQQVSETGDIGAALNKRLKHTL